MFYSSHMDPNLLFVPANPGISSQLLKVSYGASARCYYRDTWRPTRQRSQTCLKLLWPQISNHCPGCESCFHVAFIRPVPHLLNTAPQKSSSNNKLHVVSCRGFPLAFPQWLTRVNIFPPSPFARFVFNGLRAAGWSEHITSCLGYEILRSLFLQIGHQHIESGSWTPGITCDLIQSCSELGFVFRAITGPG